MMKYGQVSDSRFRESNLDPSTVGMVLFLFTEIMFFAGMLTALYVLRLQGSEGWPPPGQPRLPVLVTGFNTVVLLVSGLLLAESYFQPSKRKLLLPVSLFFGSVFLVIQGFEWIQLLGYGFKISSGIYGGFFYALVGSHALHTLAGLLILGWMTRSVLLDQWRGNYLVPSLYWFFVVLVWPIIYFTVYF